jgi:hypothetical protein
MQCVALLFPDLAIATPAVKPPGELRLLALDARAGRVAVQMPGQSETTILEAGASIDQGVRLLAINGEVAVIEWTAPESRQPVVLRMRVGESFHERPAPREERPRVVLPRGGADDAATAAPAKSAPASKERN